MMAVRLKRLCDIGFSVGITDAKGIYEVYI
jgi:hypothetical protein